MRRTIFAILVCLSFAGVAPAQDGLRENPALYPLDSFLDWTDGPMRDATDPAIGRYNFEAGFVGTVERALTRWPDRYDPERFLDPDDGPANLAGEAQVAVDAAGHNRPRLPHSHPTDAGHPGFMPDWDGDGTYGDPDDFDRDTDGDPHGETPGALDAAFFRYPCARLDGAVDFEAEGVGCVARDRDDVTFLLGLAREIKIVNARGLVLDATLWVPGGALAANGCASGSPAERFDCLAAATPAEPLPAVVFSNGVSSRQELYYWFAMRMAREGYLVLTYDPAGQGESEGIASDLFEPSPNRSECQFAGACRDLQDVTRWLTGASIAAVNGGLAGLDDRIDDHRSPAYAPAGDNVVNPLLALVDSERLALAGNSMGAVSTLDYLNHLGQGGSGIDGNPLPRVVAAVSMSGATITRAVVPIQFQTSDYDGSPLLVTPGVLGLGLGFDGQGIGYRLIKERYDCLRGAALLNPAEDCSGTDPGALSLVVFEGGLHTDHVAAPYVPRTLWSISLASDYAADWLNCHVLDQGDPVAGSCQEAISDRPFLSRAFASEQDPDGPAGPAGSLCIRVPDRASLNQQPNDFASAWLADEPVFDCEP